MIFWLKNRRPSEWRDRREHTVFDVRRAAKRIAKQIGVPVDELIAEAEAIAKAAESDRWGFRRAALTAMQLSPQRVSFYASAMAASAPFSGITAGAEMRAWCYPYRDSF